MENIIKNGTQGKDVPVCCFPNSGKGNFAMPYIRPMTATVEELKKELVLNIIDTIDSRIERELDRIDALAECEMYRIQSLHDARMRAERTE